MSNKDQQIDTEKGYTPPNTPVRPPKKEDAGYTPPTIPKKEPSQPPKERE